MGFNRRKIRRVRINNSNTHFMHPAPAHLAGVTGALLHFKFLSDFHHRAAATELFPRFDPHTEDPAADPSLHLAQCFLRLANLPNYALDRSAQPL